MPSSRPWAGAFPENLILSHDLLEGCYARAGLLSDVDLYEDYPARYAADVARRYRWIRGDWQLAGWLLRRVPGSGEREQGDAGKGRPGTRRKNPLTALSQWKLLDNLRRSLVPAALVLLLLLGWTLLSSAWLWTLVVLGILLIPSLCALLVVTDMQAGRSAGAATPDCRGANRLASVHAGGVRTSLSAV